MSIDSNVVSIDTLPSISDSIGQFFGSPADSCEPLKNPRLTDKKKKCLAAATNLCRTFLKRGSKI